MMVDYPRFWDRHSVFRFRIFSSGQQQQRRIWVLLLLVVVAKLGSVVVLVQISLSSSSTNIQQSNTGVSSLGQSSSMRFNWDKRTKNMKTTLLTKLTSNWSPSKALTLPYEIPLGKVRWNVREPDNKCTKAFMRLEKIHLKKGYKEIGGNCMDLVKGALNFLGKRGCVGNDVVRRYREIYKQDYARARKAVFEGGEERE